jgi:hypothetical protein
MKCKGCGGTLRDTDVSRHQNIARCAGCGAVFEVGDAPRAQGRLPTPDGVEVERGEELRIACRWFQPMHVVMAVACAAWLSVVGIGLIASPKPRELAFLAVMSVIGLVLCYVALSGLLNRTVYRVAGGRLDAHDGPLPWAPRRSVEVPHIDQVFVRRPSLRRALYTVNVLTKDGRRVQLGRASFATPETPLFIEHTVEAHVGIVDRPVEGEVS